MLSGIAIVSPQSRIDPLMAQPMQGIVFIIGNINIVRRKEELTKAILHPTRVRIMTQLSRQDLTPKELHNLDPSIPLGTLYRHLNTLLEAGIIKVARERRIHGTVERQFALVRGANYFSAEESAALMPADIARISATLASIVAQEFERFSADVAPPYHDGQFSMVATSLLLTEAETDELRAVIKKFVAKEGREYSPKYRRRMVAFFSVPQRDD